MSPARRRALMMGTAAAVALWPVVHLAAVARYQIDPWEFFGWAMYSEPAARVQVRLDVVRGEERAPLRAMGALRERVVAYARRRTTLGELASAEGLVNAVFESDDSIDRVELTHRRISLDRSSAILVSEDETLAFSRELARP